MAKTVMRWVGRYAIAVLTVGTTVLLRFLLPFNPTPLLIISIVVSAWFGNVWQGLLSGLLVELVVEYFFEQPPFVWDFGANSIPRVMVVFAIALLAAARKRAEIKLKVRAEQQQAIAEIGQRALEGRDLSALMNEAVELINRILNVKYAALFERQPGGELLLNTGAGWKEGVVGRLAISSRGLDGAERTLISKEPVIIKDCRKGAEVLTPQEILAHGIRSCLSVSIPGTDEPFGVIAAYHDRKRRFTDADISFLQTLAHVLADAYERKRAEDALREQREWLRVTISSIGDAVIATDTEGRVTFMNSVAETLTAWKREDAHGRPLTEVFNIINEESRQRVESPAVRVINEGVVVGLANHTVLIGKDGHERPIDDSGAPIMDSQGSIIGVVLVFHDVTERRRSDAALRESEHRFRQLAENIQDVFWMSDPKKTEILYISPAYEAVWGRSRASLYQNPLSFIEAIHPDDRPRVFATLEKQARGFETTEEYRIVRPDGSTRWVRDHAFPVQSEKGDIYRVTGIAEDITERKQIEDRQKFLADVSTVLASSLDYETTLASLSKLKPPPETDFCLIDLLEQDGSIRRLATQHRNPEKDELVGRLSLFPPDPAKTEGVAKALRTAKPEIINNVPREQLEASVRDPEHLSILLKLGIRAGMTVPILARGRTLGAMSFVTTESNRRYERDDLAFAEDLTHRVALAIDNARLYREAQEANRLKDEFLATVSHELRTPLNAITGWVAMLRRKTLGGEAAERALQVIERNARLQTQIVNDILDVSRIVTGKLRIESKPIDLAPVIEEVIDAVRPAAEAKSIKLEKHIAPGVSPVLGDAGRFQQIIWNLLSNGIKFTPRGGRVEISLESQNGDAVISVTDTGIGIKKDFLPQVFDRFLQADGSYTRSHGGLGLGLSIVRHLVEMHGGEVSASSFGEGRGSTFTIRLPHADIDRLVAYQREQLLSQPAMYPGEPSFESFPQLDNHRILVVDDEPDTRELLTAILSQCGAQVKAAASSRAALNVLAEWEPDLFILDIGMPEEDGFELIKKVRATDAERGRQIPALALTGYARLEDQKRALSSGFQLYITKPVEPDHLIRSVAGLLRQYRQNPESRSQESEDRSQNI